SSSLRWRLPREPAANERVSPLRLSFVRGVLPRSDQRTDSTVQGSCLACEDGCRTPESCDPFRYRSSLAGFQPQLLLKLSRSPQIRWRSLYPSLCVLSDVSQC